MSSTWDVGDAPTLWVEWENVAGALTATITTLTVRKPDGTILTPSPIVTSPSVGRYQATVKVDQDGTWHYDWLTDDVLTAAEGGYFDVRRSPVLA